MPEHIPLRSYWTDILLQSETSATVLQQSVLEEETLRNEEKDATKSPRFFPARGLQVLFCEQKRLRHRSFYNTVLVCPRTSTSTSHQQLYSPVWAPAS
jgi:hypothetical protein